MHPLLLEFYVPNRWSGLRYTVPCAVAFLCLHAAGTLLFPFATTGISYAFLTMAPVCAVVACTVHTADSSDQLRTNWLLIVAGLTFWAIAMAISAWGDMVAHANRNVAFLSDFVYFFYGVPILLAISQPADRHHSWPFAWIDGSQAVIAGILAYIQIFSVIPFANQASEPISISLLLRTYNIENLVLACAASLRLQSCPRRTGKRRFYGLLATFLWLYAICAGIYNLLDVHAVNEFGARDLLVDLPFLSLAVAVLALPRWLGQSPKRESSKSSLAIFIENGSTVFFTFALLALGASVMRNHFKIGISSIAIALVLYGLRATLLQSRYMESQQALQETRDRLEELSLQDALTSVANRRRFDWALEVEWSRATRMCEPLSLLMLDVDFFKRLNDRYGHRSGDECLIQIARALQSCLPRSSDLLARYGGEEFAVILPSTGRAGAESVAARMKQAVLDLNIQYDAAESLYTTISVGIATYEFPQPGSFSHLIEAADQALYKAKQNGRNRIEFVAMEVAGFFPTAG
jgi:diguanylate cyclase (GGDEF)-like protein